MGICAAMFTASLMAACGGGAGSGTSATDTATAAPGNGGQSGSASSETSAQTPGTMVDLPPGSDTVNSTLAVLQVAEATVSTIAIKAISAALIDV